MNRKTTARSAREMPGPKNFLPKKNQQRVMPRPKQGNQGKSRKGSNNTQGVISASRVRTTEVIERSIPLFSARSTKRLRYSTSFSLASTAGVVVSYVLAANGLWDPDVTGTGHQPMGFDEMMLYYNHFCVTSCRIQVVAKGLSSSKMTVCLRQDASPTPLTSIDRIVEIGGAVIEYLEVAATFGATKRLEAAVDIAKLQGINRSALTADSTLRGSVVANPTELSYFHVQVWDSAAQTGTVYCDVILDFVAVFMEPRDATTSLQARMDQLLAQRLSLTECKAVAPVKGASWLGL